MLSEGRRWWITANSDSHIHYTEGSIDFWPGEYSKTFVHAEKAHEHIGADRENVCGHRRFDHCFGRDPGRGDLGRVRRDAEAKQGSKLTSRSLSRIRRRRTQQEETPRSIGLMSSWVR